MTDQIGVAKPPTFYEDDVEHRRQIADYVKAVGDRANATIPKDGSELTQMLKLDSLDVAITADTDDLDLSDYSVVRADPDAGWDLTGIVAEDNRALAIINVGSFNLTLKDQSIASDVSNRMALGGDIILTPDDAQLLWYDPTDARWRKATG